MWYSKESNLSLLVVAEGFLGDWSAREAGDKNQHNSAVIRGVPLELSDSNMASSLTDNFPRVRVQRFVKKKCEITAN